MPGEAGRVSAQKGVSGREGERVGQVGEGWGRGRVSTKDGKKGEAKFGSKERGRDHKRDGQKYLSRLLVSRASHSVPCGLGHLAQVLGLCYIILELLDFYGFMFRGAYYSADPVWFNAMKLTGILVTAAALRNFGHLAKSNVNKGMFAESRTFSYGAHPSASARVCSARVLCVHR